MARKLAWLIVALMLAPLAAWWIDSAVTCEVQDRYTLRGLCKMQVKAKAEAGDTASQWTYGLHLLEGDPPAAREWLNKAAGQARTGIEVAQMHGLCRLVFDPVDVEAKFLQVASTSPDAHLLLLDLYLDPHCGKRDLDKAAAQIPRLSQCGSLALKDFLDSAARDRFEVTRGTALAIKRNVEQCRAEIRQPPTYPRQMVTELLEPKADELSSLELRIAAFLGRRE